jgi:hypothetical protein
LMTPDGRMYVVTKGDAGPIGLYRFPRQPQRGGSVLERVGGPQSREKRGGDDRITDGAASPDGAWIVLRTARALLFYRAADLTAGHWREAGRMDLRELGESQGEGVAWAADNSIYLVGEGGGGSQPGTFARLVCAPGR